jgi:RimJ/RimL family protein N-acetyltransferase
MLSHRKAQKTDFETVCSFVQDAQELFYLFPTASYPLTPGQLADNNRNRVEATVALKGDRLVGHANFYHWEQGGTCAIGNVIIAPEVRGQGVGRYLIGQMLDTAYTKYQASRVKVSCFNHNTAGLLFYSNLGFRPFGVEERIEPQGGRVAIIHMHHRR